MTKFTRRSLATGITHTVELPITQEEWDKFLKSNSLIQRAFPNLTPDQREFLISGTTPDEWDEMFGDDDEEEDTDTQERPETDEIPN